MDSEITLRIENWRGGDWDETQNGAHVMRSAKPGNYLTRTQMATNEPLINFTYRLNPKYFWIAISCIQAIEVISDAQVVSNRLDSVSM